MEDPETGKEINRYCYKPQNSGDLLKARKLSVKRIELGDGYDISPEEAEIVVTSHPKIQEDRVIGYPDERMGEKTCICVMPIPLETITLEVITQ